jgi:hypothetical protein
MNSGLLEGQSGRHRRDAAWSSVKKNSVAAVPLAPQQTGCRHTRHCRDKCSARPDSARRAAPAHDVGAQTSRSQRQQRVGRGLGDDFHHKTT